MSQSYFGRFTKQKNLTCWIFAREESNQTQTVLSKTVNKSQNDSFLKTSDSRVLSNKGYKVVTTQLTRNWLILKNFNLKEKKIKDISIHRPSSLISLTISKNSKSSVQTSNQFLPNKHTWRRQEEKSLGGYSNKIAAAKKKNKLQQVFNFTASTENKTKYKTQCKFWFWFLWEKQRKNIQFG